DAAPEPRPVVQGVHAGVDPRPVRAKARGAGAREALVLGLLPALARLLPSHGLCERLYLPRHGLVQLRAPGSGRAAVAAREVPGELAAARSDLGAGDRALAGQRT